MLRYSLTLTAAAVVLCAGAAHADVYMFKDAQGNVQYTDKPPTLPAERLNVQSRKTDVVEVQAREQAELAKLKATDEARQKSNAAQTDQQSAAELTAKDKAERCTKARERYDKYATSQRLYETQANGERRYLSDAELDAARSSAKSTMDEFCK
ncbi:MAG TPA: DUF4124 domain-containing protein [Povalibacter sp.]|uniref:DUF4124 domain-containing protein n=1 Tax=Povalibacter sp. TaxID=1962978 RepID=UPI002B7C6632|nr:DUF4124 domain-containing protein [Povalibacter sp.]HMN43499.1 DUF4124 domain-containing protein [Povalibacter sp.]